MSFNQQKSSDFKSISPKYDVIHMMYNGFNPAVEDIKYYIYITQSILEKRL